MLLLDLKDLLKTNLQLEIGRELPWLGPRVLWFQTEAKCSAVPDRCHQQSNLFKKIIKNILFTTPQQALFTSVTVEIMLLAKLQSHKVLNKEAYSNGVKRIFIGYCSILIKVSYTTSSTKIQYQCSHVGYSQGYK